jgi:glycosyltransferase involved in cell wall biosynthesis
VKRIFFYGFNPAAGGRWRSIWPAEHMSSLGFDARAGTSYPDPGSVDVLIAHRPLGREGAYWVKLHRHNGAKVLVSIDDDLTAIPDWNGSKAGYTEDRLDGHDRAIQAADGIVVTTRRLVDVYGHLARRSWIVPNLIPDWVRKVKLRPTDPGIRVGWMGSVFVHKGDLHWIRPVVDRMLRGAIFETVGDTRVPVVLGVTGPCQAWGWEHGADGVDLYRRMARVDIGIVPLDPGLPFNLAKSSIKALEYAILGKPVVATRLPEFEAFVRHGVDGFLVDTPTEFADAVQTLVADPVLRLTMGASAQARAKEWTMEARGDLWAKMIGDVCGRKKTRTQAEAAGPEAGRRESRETADSRTH